MLQTWPPLFCRVDQIALATLSGVWVLVPWNVRITNASYDWVTPLETTDQSKLALGRLRVD